MPYNVSNPVNFYAGGDTTSQAIGKHISEFAKVYEILNGLDDNGQGIVVVRSKTKLLKDGQVGIVALNSGWMELRVGDGESAWMDLPDGVQLKNVVNVLDSTDAGAPLSAAQGKALKELLDAIKVPEIVDDLVTGGADKVLSAEQGKALKALIDAFETPQPGPPGPKGIEWRGTWDADAEYREDDAVSYMGGSYIAIKVSSNKKPPDAEYWGVLSTKGADGIGAGDMTKAVYDSDGDGKVDVAVAADTATRAGTADTVAWDNVTGKPEKFTCDIVDALDSDRTDAALSAKQGKELSARHSALAAKVPDTFVERLALSPSKQLTIPGTASDQWFVQVFTIRKQVSTPEATDTMVPVYMTLYDQVAAAAMYIGGAGILCVGGSKIMAYGTGILRELIPDADFQDIAALLFVGRKIN